MFDSTRKEVERIVEEKIHATRPVVHYCLRCRVAFQRPASEYYLKNKDGGVTYLSSESVMYVGFGVSAIHLTEPENHTHCTRCAPGVIEKRLAEERAVAWAKANLEKAKECMERCNQASMNNKRREKK